MVQLRGGHRTEDPRLDRVPQLDPRSRDFPVRTLIKPTLGLRGRKWLLKLRLNQGQEGACTGFARAHDLAASPGINKDITNDVARAIYTLARANDEWPGEDYEGSSVLGAVKAAVLMGYVGEYRWAFGIDDMVGALATVGPVVVGTDLVDSQWDTRPNGLWVVEGSNVVGGHSYIYNRVIFSKRYIKEALGKGEPIREGVPLLGGINSWGEEWGVGGAFLQWADDTEKLLKGISNPGEAAISTKNFVKAKVVR